MGFQPLEKLIPPFVVSLEHVTDIYFAAKEKAVTCSSETTNGGVRLQMAVAASQVVETHFVAATAICSLTRTYDGLLLRCEINVCDMFE